MLLYRHMIIEKTPENPHGLSTKQRLVIEAMVENAKGGAIRPTDAHKVVYNTNGKNSLSTVTAQNLRKVNFREGLLEELTKAGIVGERSAISKHLMEGLSAEAADGRADYNVRLKYIQEIHKVIGIYAPQKIEKKTLSLHADISEDELDDRIEQLQGELK